MSGRLLGAGGQHGRDHDDLAVGGAFGGVAGRHRGGCGRPWAGAPPRRGYRSGVVRVSSHEASRSATRLTACSLVRPTSWSEPMTHRPNTVISTATASSSEDERSERRPDKGIELPVVAGLGLGPERDARSFPLRRAPPWLAPIEECRQLSSEQFDPRAKPDDPVEELRRRHPQVTEDLTRDLGRKGSGGPEVVGDRPGGDIGSPGDGEHRRRRHALMETKPF